MKNALILSVLCFGMFLCKAQSSDYLVAYYPLNGSAFDISALNNHGILKGTTAVNDRFGNEGSAIYFNGKNDYIKIPHNESLNFDINKDSYTICFWYKSEMISFDKTCLITKSNDYMTSPYPFNVYAKPGELSFDVRDKGAISNPNTSIKDTELLYNWNHIAVIVKNNHVATYINGKLANEQFFKVQQNTKCANDIFIGTDYFNTTYFKGALDDMRVYSTALSPDIVYDIYNTDNYELVKQKERKGRDEEVALNTPLNDEPTIHTLQ